MDVSTYPGSPPSAPAGWYQDHRNGGWLWWDGYRWHAPPPVAPERRWWPDLPTLKGPAAAVGVAYMVLITILGRATTELDGAAGFVVALLSLGAGTVGLLAVAWAASRVWGTGRFVDDLGYRFRWLDVPIGIGAGIALTIGLIVFNLIWYATGLPTGSNLDEVRDGGMSGAAFLFLFVLAVVIAPLTEEAMFRGVIQRGLGSVVAGWGPVLLQAAVFGLAHLTPDQGWGNVNLMVGLALMGLGLGVVSRLTGRLGTPIVAHATFNAIQLTLLWLTLG